MIFPASCRLICGLMFVYGLDILTGEAFTYEPLLGAKDGERKIVDVFTVRPVRDGKAWPEIWPQYAQDLEELLHMMRAGQRREARGLLAKRVGAMLFELAGHESGRDESRAGQSREAEAEFQPGARSRSVRRTVVGRTVVRRKRTIFCSRLRSRSTMTAPSAIPSCTSIRRIRSGSCTSLPTRWRSTASISPRCWSARPGSRVRDTLFVTDENGQKITDPERQRELRAATVLIKHFTHLLPHSPNPESALLHFREFIGQLFKRAQLAGRAGLAGAPGGAASHGAPAGGQRFPVG